MAMRLEIFSLRFAYVTKQIESSTNFLRATDKHEDNKTVADDRRRRRLVYARVRCDGLELRGVR